jgi:acyl carrier protein
MNTPTREEVVAKAIKLIHDFVPELQDAELTEDSNINTDAAMDSMSMILVITKLESAFDVQIPSDEWGKIRTLGQLADAVMERL